MQETLNKLRELKLEGMYNAYAAVLSSPLQEQPTLHQFVTRLADAEALDRDNKKAQINIKQSRMRYNAILEQIECSPTRNLGREQIELLSDCSFINRGENILITGATGCGKSYLACAVGRHACSFGYKVTYIGIIPFVEMISQSKIDGSYMKQIKKIEKSDILIIDDFGLHPLTQNARSALLQILEDRYDIKSTIITSQLPVAKWHAYIGESTLADAILDRLSANAHRIELKGQSLRTKNKK